MQRKSLGIIVVSAFFLLVVMALVTVPPNPGLKGEHEGFQMLESDELYFKNMRQFYYESEQHKEAGLVFHRLKGLDSDKPLSFAIAISALQDEAYIVAEQHRVLVNTPFSLMITSGDGAIEFHFEPGSMIAHQGFAKLVYDALGADEEREFTLVLEGKEVPVWTSRSEQKGVLRVLKDYFKLVRAV